jgi:hypothetical protein
MYKMLLVLIESSGRSALGVCGLLYFLDLADCVILDNKLIRSSFAIAVG